MKKPKLFIEINKEKTDRIRMETEESRILR